MQKVTANNFIAIGKKLLFAVLWAAGLALAWVIVHASVKNEWIFPSLSDTLKRAVGYLGEKSFYRAFGNTLWRTFRAFFLSLIPATALGVIAYLLPLFRKIFSPLVKILRATPTMAIILIILISTTPDEAPVSVAFLALFPMLYTSAEAALSSVDPSLVQMSKVYRVPLQKQIWGLYLPTAAPYAVKEWSAALSFSLKLVVSAEVLANTYISLGGMMQQARIFVEVPELFALTILTVLTGFLLETITGFLAWLCRREKA